MVPVKEMFSEEREEEVCSGIISEVVVRVSMLERDLLFSDIGRVLCGCGNILLLTLVKRNKSCKV